jgi:hypothetical protein
MRHFVLLGTIALRSACSDRAAPPAATTEAQAVVPAQAPEARSTDAGLVDPASRTTAGAQAPSDETSNLLSADGVGAVRFGMTLAQAEAATGDKASLPAPFDPACSMVRFPALPKLRFMVEEGIVTRADAEAGVGNAMGIAVGDTLAQVRAEHPEAKVTAHKYEADGHYVSFPSADGGAAIIAEESGGKVTRVRAGLQPAVAYVETCG